MPKLGINPKIIHIARELGVRKNADPEEGIRDVCFLKVEKIINEFIVGNGGSVDSLDKLLDLVAAKIDLKFEEVFSDEDLDEIKNRYVSKGELAFLEFMDEFDTDTDAILVELKKAKSWEQKYLAIVDCRDIKKYRAYFSKWHEIAHLLSTPPQRNFIYRRTNSVKRDPEEILMDKIAGDLGFYSPLFLPEVRARTDKKKKLTFDIIDEIRREVCPSASLESTIRGVVERVSFPCLFIKVDYALKKGEERLLNSNQGFLFPIEKEEIKKKIRAVQVQSNNYARKVGMQIYKNMEVPSKSIIFDIFNNPGSLEVVSNVENLNWWKSSKGHLNKFKVYVEAKKVGNKVWALISPS